MAELQILGRCSDAPPPCETGQRLYLSHFVVILSLQNSSKIT